VKLPFFLTNLKSNYCKVVFVISLILGYFSVPHHIYSSDYVLLTIPFIFLFAFTITCIVKSIKERVVASKKEGSSLLAILANVIGISTLQVCGLGVPSCGASIGVGIVTSIFPDILVNYFQEYAVWILIFSILIQIYSLYSLNCIFQKKKLG
jgi:hypothetical protein